MVKANGDAFDGRRSALNDHLHVMYALARPGRHQHLGAMSPFNGEFFDSDLASLASNLTRTVNEAGARNALAAEQEWNDILAGLGQPSAKAEQAQEVTVAGGERIAVDEAVVDLSQLLYNLEVESTALAAGRTKQKGAKMVAIVDEDGNEEWIRMDSTRRKRKKKINKHKYKKRRKVGLDFCPVRVILLIISGATSIEEEVGQVVGHHDVVDSYRLSYIMHPFTLSSALSPLSTC